MKVIVFSGTSEGKEIAQYLSNLGIRTVVCVATDYGKEVMEELPHVTVHVGRMDEEQIADFIVGYDLLIDATHPYAKEVTKNLKQAAKRSKVEYIRLLREDTNRRGTIQVSNVNEAVSYLKEHAKSKTDRIFVSTGSKELACYVAIPDYQERIVARVLPIEESKEKCEQLGLEHVIYEKGPFTFEQNIEAFKRYKTTWLVTKNGGQAGGFGAKIKAAEMMNMQSIIIERPDEEGLCMEAVKEIIQKR